MTMLAAGAVAASAAEADILHAYRWKSRVLVVSAPDRADPRIARQARMLAADERGSMERDLVVVEAIGADAEAKAVRERLGLPETGFRAVLVGKDGGAKLTSAEPIPREKLFSTIDAMPMRRQEAKSR